MISIVLPTYNEIDNLKKLIYEILTVFKKEKINGNIIIIDDNSPDKTGILADKLSRAFANQIFVIHREKKLGLGSAYIAGFKKALELKADYIFEMDSDFSHNPHSIPSFLDNIKSCDLVIGSRYINGGATKNWKLHRKLISRGGTIYAQKILNINVNDLTSGFRCYKRKALESIDLNNIKSDGYSFQIEMAYRTAQTGLKIKEIPIIFLERNKGISKFSKKIFWEAFFKVWQLRFTKQ